MTPHLLPSGHRAGAVALFATTSLVLALAPANARITEAHRSLIDIDAAKYISGANAIP
jgi:hypothetical protein